MAEESDLERTEPASSRRLEQAREEGQVPRSREVGAFLVLMVAAGAFWMVGGWMMQRTSTIVSRGLLFDGEMLRDPQLMVTRFGDIALDALLVFAPFVLALIVAALLSPFFLGSWNISFKAMAPDLGRIDPVKGLSRIISWSGLLELVKGVAKATLIGGVAAGVLWGERGEIISLLTQTIDAGLASAGHLINFSFLMIVASMLLIVALDVPFQLWQYHNKLKMTKEEVRRESKEMEGNPEVKGRIRSMQREAARLFFKDAAPSDIYTVPFVGSVRLVFPTA